MEDRHQISVKVSRRFQIAVPQKARKQLHIHAGDRLLVDIQGGILLLLPMPESYSDHMKGLHQEIWKGEDAKTIIDEEHEAWNPSTNE